MTHCHVACTAKGARSKAGLRQVMHRPGSFLVRAGKVQLEVSEPFTQPRALSAALLERQLVLLGVLLASVSETNQLLILDVLTAASTAPPPKRGLRETPGRRRAVLTALCCAALAGLDSLARRYRGQPSMLLPYSGSCPRNGTHPH